MEDEIIEKSEAQAAIDVMRELHAPTPIDASALQAAALLVLPEGLKVHDLKPFQDKRLRRPERLRGTAKLTTLESFIEHVLRFKDEHSAIFAIDDPRAPKLLAVFDYHETPGAPRFTEHRAEYAFPLADEWRTWLGLAEQKLDQSAFAQLLEDRIADVLEPTQAGVSLSDLATQLGVSLAGPSTLLTLSRGLSIRVDHKLAQAVNLSTGETQLNFEETHTTKDGSALKVPGGFALAIPVFRNGTRYQIFARLRYRAGGGAITWRVLLHRSELVFQDAFGEACGQAADATGLPLFYGTPES